MNYGWESGATMRALARGVLAAAVLASVGCGASMAVAGPEELPVDRVVLYRNGVGYFERHGAFDADRLVFEVRHRDVGDFLSSLTAVDHGGAGVTSIAFSTPDADSEAIAAPDLRGLSHSELVEVTQGMLERLAERAEPSDEDGVPVEVTLHFADDSTHRVAMSYVVEAPIWRPTYRVIVEEDDVLLQAWAVVQNVSGEDWEDVSLSLTTGSPIAFRSDLGEAVIPERPVIADRGEVIRGVPTAAVAYAERDLEAARPAPEAAVAARRPNPSSGVLGSLGTVGRGQASARSGQGYGRGSGSLSNSRGRRAPRPPPQAQASTIATAAAAVMLSDGVTRYDVEERVTVPDGGSTMVGILSERIAGRLLHLYAPDSRVPSSNTYPFRGVRFVNETGAALERGGVSIYGEGTFLGQGMLEPMPAAARTFVPFAVDRSLSVTRQVRNERVAGRLIRIENGRFTIEQYSERHTTYAVRNGGDAPVTVLARHAVLANAEYVSRPEGIESSVGADLIPIEINATSEAELVVVERSPIRRTIGFGPLAAQAVLLYLEGSAVDAVQGPRLREALRLSDALTAARHSSATAERRRTELQGSAAQTRQNLEAVREIRRAADLRQRLTRRLGELDEEIAALTAEIVEAQTAVSELGVRLQEAIAELDLGTEEVEEGS